VTVILSIKTTNRKYYWNLSSHLL